MKRFIHLFAGLLPSIVFGQTFMQNFADFKSNPERLSISSRAHAHKVRFVFVPGFLNELSATYFSDLRAELRSIGVLKQHISMIRPVSSRSVDENAEPLLRAWEWEYFKTPDRPLVIIAHSKGASESLAAAFNNPSFVNAHIERIFLVQGAIGGSAIADYMLNLAPEPDQRMRREYRLLLTSLKANRPKLEQILSLPVGAGIESLTHRAAEIRWTAAKKNISSSDLATLDQKISYVVGATDVSKMTSKLRPTGSYLELYFGGESDGLVKRRDQFLDGVGTVIADVDIDHAGLVAEWPSSSTPKNVRRAFLRSILAELAP